MSMLNLGVKPTPRFSALVSKLCPVHLSEALESSPSLHLLPPTSGQPDPLNPNASKGKAKERKGKSDLKRGGSSSFIIYIFLRGSAPNNSARRLESSSYLLDGTGWNTRNKQQFTTYLSCYGAAHVVSFPKHVVNTWWFPFRHGGTPRSSSIWDFPS